MIDSRLYQEVDDIFKKKIAIGEMTFADWQAIGDAIGSNPAWAYYRWVECSDPDLPRLTIGEWKAIAEKCEFKKGWAYYQYEEHSA